MTLEAAVLNGIAASLGRPVVRAVPVSGGCISPSFRTHLEGGAVVFVKTAPEGAGPDLLAQEAVSLDRLGEAGAVRVPRVLGRGDGWLALEWLEPRVGTSADWALLGRRLAGLHGVKAEAPGWPADNYIGPLPQRNASAGSWADFWARRRLAPQLELAGGRVAGRMRALFDRIMDEVDDRLAGAEADGYSLLHGDLWNGNVHMTSEGPALVDPSSWFGHREVDLAMADLFGGFPREFRGAYDAEWPPLPGAAARRPVYQLYYLLVHLNLFGDAYLAGTERALRAALA
ncbi:MAG TPA: fructosamine kinase family protein [Longimicrobiales bacterium]|nr:fructosamine kinase family protein [Longimicrobiales bacterium]